MLRFVGQTAHRGFQVFAGNGGKPGGILPGAELGQSRPCSDGCRAPANLVNSLGHAPGFHPYREPQDIAANRIRNLDRDRWGRKLSDVAGGPKMIDQLGAHDKSKCKLSAVRQLTGYDNCGSRNYGKRQPDSDLPAACGPSSSAEMGIPWR